MRSQTGYTNVIEVGGKYQARLQVKGGVRVLPSHSLPWGGSHLHPSSIASIPQNSQLVEASALSGCQASAPLRVTRSTR